MQEIFDIIIVGAGPAGATFAWQMAGKSKKILLLNSNGLRPEKPCGGLLAPAAQKELAKLGLNLPSEILVDPQIFSVKTIDLSTELIKFYPRSYINIDRTKFDNWLKATVPDSIHKLEALCVKIEPKYDYFQLTCKTKNGTTETFLTTKIVGADGANSLVRNTFFKDFKITKYISIQQHFESSGLTPFYSCIFDEETSSSCSWSISKNDSLIFGGAFLPQNAKKNFEKQKIKLEKFGYKFKNLIKTEACMLLKPNFKNGFCFGNENIFLIGEAAGFISPTGFEGISNALGSAVGLAKSFESKKILKSYKENTKFLQKQIFKGHLKYPFMYNPILRKFVMQTGVQSIDLY